MQNQAKWLRNSILVLVASVAVVAGAQQPPVVRDQTGVPGLISNGGARVLDVSAAPGGMTAYTVEKDGKPLIFYVSPDRSVAFVGVMFDARTGKNLSDAYVENSQKLLAGGQITPPTGLQSQSVEERSIAGHLASAAVVGVTEGRASSADTTFVFFDPRCPYCHKLYQNTRELAKRGATIKWIPVNTLGDVGVPIAVQAVRRGKEGMDALANGRIPSGGTVSMKERAEIEANTSLMRTLVQQQPGMKMATPTIVFQDKSRKLTMYQDDGTDKAALMASFGR